MGVDHEAPYYYLTTRTTDSALAWSTGSWAAPTGTDASLEDTPKVAWLNPDLPDVVVRVGS